MIFAGWSRGHHQDIVLHGNLFESLDDYAKKHPLVVPIPAGRLLTNVNPQRAIQINEPWRQVLWSGFIHSMICKKNGETITNAYAYENVGVIKDLDILAFKSFVRAEGDEVSAPAKDHGDYKNFVETIFNKLSGPTTLQQLPDWEQFLKSMNKLEEQLLHSSVFFTDEQLATLFIDIHRLLRHEFGNRGLALETAASNIFSELDKSYRNAQVVIDCQNSILLPHLLGQHAKPRKQIKVPPIPGSAIVDVHRIAVSHAIESKLLNNVRQSSPQVDQNLLDTYTRRELVTGMVHLFPQYLQRTLDAFWKQHVWEHLDMDKRHPVPSLYYFQSPAKEEIDKST